MEILRIGGAWDRDNQDLANVSLPTMSHRARENPCHQSLRSKSANVIKVGSFGEISQNRMHRCTAVSSDTMRRVTSGQRSVRGAPATNDSRPLNNGKSSSPFPHSLHQLALHAMKEHTGAAAGWPPARIVACAPAPKWLQGLVGQYL